MKTENEQMAMKMKHLKKQKHINGKSNGELI